MAPSVMVGLCLGLVICLTIPLLTAVLYVEHVASAGAGGYIAVIVVSSFLCGGFVVYILSRLRVHRSLRLTAREAQKTSAVGEHRARSSCSDEPACSIVLNRGMSSSKAAREALQQSICIGGTQLLYQVPVEIHASSGSIHAPADSPAERLSSRSMEVGNACANARLTEEKKMKTREPRHVMASIPKGAMMMKPSMRKVTLAAALLQLLEGESKMNVAERPDDHREYRSEGNSPASRASGSPVSDIPSGTAMHAGKSPMLRSQVLVGELAYLVRSQNLIDPSYRMTRRAPLRGKNSKNVRSTRSLGNSPSQASKKEVIGQHKQSVSRIF
eukprot:GEMP01033372.1.p1 GENE.GEMP01033372.1~~GEMP01033372.1.p1  ORF type:complete len:329 (+),score=76.93 GEMP01033372.1:252-1238(+)